MEDIRKKITVLDDHFRSTDSNQQKSEYQRLLERLTKLNEEVGELCEATLCTFDSNQRMKDRDTDFEKELADVFICTMMLAQSCEKDFTETVHEVLNKNLRRHNLI